MESDSTLDFGQTSQEHLQITSISKAFLKEAARWAHFIAILGFIGLGIMVLLALSMGTIVGNVFATQGFPVKNFPILAVTIFYLALTAVYFFPIYYLFKFASKLKLALKNEAQDFLDSAFEFLKSHYKFIGILSIVLLGFYLLMIIIFIAAIGFSGLS